MPPAHAAPRRRPSPGAPALRSPLGADLLLAPTPPHRRHFAGKGWFLPFFYFKDWGKILGSDYTHRLIRLCSEEENKSGKGACSTREPVNCFPVAILCHPSQRPTSIHPAPPLPEHRQGAPTPKDVPWGCCVGPGLAPKLGSHMRSWPGSGP